MLRQALTPNLATDACTRPTLFDCAGRLALPLLFFDAYPSYRIAHPLMLCACPCRLDLRGCVLLMPIWATEVCTHIRGHQLTSMEQTPDAAKPIPDHCAFNLFKVLSFV